jgi:hypothetical protein
MVHPLHILVAERVVDSRPLLAWQVYRSRWLEPALSLLGPLTHTLVALCTAGTVPRIDSFVTLRASRTGPFAIHVATLAVALPTRLAALFAPLHILIGALITLHILFRALTVMLRFLLVAGSRLLVVLSIFAALAHLAVGLSWLHPGVAFTPLFVAAVLLDPSLTLATVLLSASLTLTTVLLSATTLSLTPGPAFMRALRSTQARGSQQRSGRSRC